MDHREVYGGCVIGDERVITLHNGSYSFGGTAAGSAAAACVCFDEQGRRVGRTAEPVVAATTRRRVDEKEVVQHSCVVPLDGGKPNA